MAQISRAAAVVGTVGEIEAAVVDNLVDLVPVDRVPECLATIN